MKNNIQQKICLWSYPLENFRSEKPLNGRAFGASRDDSKRAHAGVDLYAPIGTNVIAVADGEVIDIDHFYGGTDEVAVKNDDGIVVRYTELDPLVKVGDKLKKGDVVGKIIPNNICGSHMLHIEVYEGTETGPLTDRNNENYKYVPSANYNRRPDLIDPTFVSEIE